MPEPRGFPPPWIVEEHAESFIVRDATGQALGYFHFHEGKSTGRPSVTKRLNKDEARQMALNFTSALALACVNWIADTLATEMTAHMRSP